MFTTLRVSKEHETQRNEADPRTNACTDLRAQCKKFPTPRRTHIELLEVNASASSTTDSEIGAFLNLTRSDLVDDVIVDAQKVYVNNTLVWET